MLQYTQGKENVFAANNSHQYSPPDWPVQVMYVMITRTVWTDVKF